MVGEVIGGLGAFKAMFDLAKGLKDINDAATRNAVAIELQEKILSAQAQQSTLIESVGKLEAEVTGFKNWDAQKKRYQLTDFGSGTFAFALKQDMSDGEPPHRICAPCYEKQQRSILQFIGRTGSEQDIYDCPSCKTRFLFGQARPRKFQRPDTSWMV